MRGKEEMSAQIYLIFQSGERKSIRHGLIYLPNGPLIGNKIRKSRQIMKRSVYFDFRLTSQRELERKHFLGSGNRQLDRG